jgi:hypothetical protein
MPDRGAVEGVNRGDGSVVMSVIRFLLSQGSSGQRMCVLLLPKMFGLCSCAGRDVVVEPEDVVRVVETFEVGEALAFAIPVAAGMWCISSRSRKLTSAPNCVAPT